MVDVLRVELLERSHNRIDVTAGIGYLGRDRTVDRQLLSNYPRDSRKSSTCSRTWERMMTSKHPRFGGREARVPTTPSIPRVCSSAIHAGEGSIPSRLLYPIPRRAARRPPLAHPISTMRLSRLVAHWLMRQANPNSPAQYVDCRRHPWRCFDQRTLIAWRRRCRSPSVQ